MSEQGSTQQPTRISAPAVNIDFAGRGQLGGEYSGERNYKTNSVILLLAKDLIISRRIQSAGLSRASEGPTNEGTERLLRYEAHLSREFDRTLSQLERLQRMRKGQQVLPPIKVEVSP